MDVVHHVEPTACPGSSPAPASDRGVCWLPECCMPKQKRKEIQVVVPIPSSDTQAEHDRIRKSNDRDQRLEREGKTPPHNKGKGYDEAADGHATPKGRHVVDES